MEAKNHIRIEDVFLKSLFNYDSFLNEVYKLREKQGINPSQLKQKREKILKGTDRQTRKAVIKFLLTTGFDVQPYTNWVKGKISQDSVKEIYNLAIKIQDFEKKFLLSQELQRIKSYPVKVPSFLSGFVKNFILYDEQQKFRDVQKPSNINMNFDKTYGEWFVSVNIHSDTTDKEIEGLLKEAKVLIKGIPSKRKSKLEGRPNLERDFKYWWLRRIEKKTHEEANQMIVEEFHHESYAIDYQYATQTLTRFEKIFA